MELMMEREVNAYYWAFIELVIKKPEVYLSRRGKILYKLVELDGKSKSITAIAHLLEMPDATVSNACRKITDIKMIKKGNKIEVKFDEGIVKQLFKQMKK